MKVVPAPHSSQAQNLSETQDVPITIICRSVNEAAVLQNQTNDTLANIEIETEINKKIEMSEKRKEEIGKILRNQHVQRSATVEFIK